MEWTDRQRQRLSDISADIGQVTLASIFLPFLIDDFHLLLALLGLLLSMLFWSISMFLLRSRS